MRIGICENEAAIREQLQELVAAYPTEEKLETVVFASGEAMLNDAEGFDLAFLDIELGEGINGLAVAQELGEQKQRHKRTHGRNRHLQQVHPNHSFQYGLWCPGSGKSCAGA